MARQCVSDFVKELVALLHEKKVRMPFENEKPWHELFYELKYNEKAPDFINCLRFDWDGPYPHSRELSDFLHALHWNVSVSANNPSFDEISLSEEVANLWQKRISELGPSDLDFLNIASEKAQIKFEHLKVQ